MPGLASSAPPTSCLVTDDAGAADCLPPCWARRRANAGRAAAAPATCGIAARPIETASAASMAAGLLSRDLISDRPPVPATPAAGPALRLAGSEREMALCLSLDTVGDFPRSGRGPIKGYGAFRKTSVSLCGNLNRAAIANHFREHYAAC